MCELSAEFGDQGEAKPRTEAIPDSLNGDDWRPISRPCLSLPCVLAQTAVMAYLMYMPQESAHPERPMQRKAKVFMNNRSQAIRLPKEFQFNTQEVFIRKKGNEVVLSPRPFDWSSYLAEGPVASMNFMDGVEDLPVQEREP